MLFAPGSTNSQMIGTWPLSQEDISESSEGLLQTISSSGEIWNIVFLS